MFVSKKPLYIALFVLFGLYAFPASGQDHSTLSPPLPGQAPRGAYSRGDYYVPDDLLPALRANAVIVSTTADENTDCNPASGTGISLREALEICLAAAGDEGLTIYVPAGTYALTNNIAVIPNSFALIGQDPLTTIFETPGMARIFTWLPSDDHGTIANVTMRDAGGPTASGGAIFVNGIGSLTLDNVVVREGATNSAGGGGLHVTDFSSSPGHIDLSIRQSTITENESPGPGGGIVFLIDSSGSGALTVTDSVISGNNAENDGACAVGFGGGGIFVRSTSALPVSVTIENVLFQDNDALCNNGAGGSLLLYSYSGPVTLNVVDSEVTGSTNASKLYGGGFAAFGDMVTATFRNVYAHGNAATLGGGISVVDSPAFRLADSLVSGNTAASGGGVAVVQVVSATIENTVIANNSAVNNGGIVFQADSILVANSRITGNTASGNGGGMGVIDDVSVATNGATLINTLIEDNTAAISPDCYNLNSDTIESLGGVGMTDTTGCDFFPHPTDQFDNLVLNGGFEVQGVNAATPDGWKRANITGDKRKCNGDKPVTRYGNCAYVFVGGPGEASTLSQNVSTLGFADGETLRLYAQGEGGAATKATVVVKAVYSDPIPASKAKLTFKGLSDIGNFLSKDLVLIDGTLSQLQVKVTNTASSGKFTIDRVYLFSVSMFGRLNSGDVLPPPAAPSGFRGGN